MVGIVILWERSAAGGNNSCLLNLLTHVLDIFVKFKIS